MRTRTPACDLCQEHPGEKMFWPSFVEEALTVDKFRLQVIALRKIPPRGHVWTAEFTKKSSVLLANVVAARLRMQSPLWRHGHLIALGMRMCVNVVLLHCLTFVHGDDLASNLPSLCLTLASLPARH